MNSSTINDLVSAKPNFPNEIYKQQQGVAMTSQRTRNRLIKELIDLGVEDYAVLNAIKVTPRHLFLDEAMASRAYENTALPIGFQQTISQPWVVAKMSVWLFQGEINKVLEVGTGSGYQTAILALLAKHVYSVERIQPLLTRAKSVLDSLRINNVEYLLTDGHWGWSEHALYDGIISAASPAKVPDALIEQLKEGGRLVMPIGEKEQLLYGFIKTATGYSEECLGEVLFVPMREGIHEDI
jgi:protein-L-isoaspartate(D-aspartate) O-methyltransferase